MIVFIEIFFEVLNFLLYKLVMSLLFQGSHRGFEPHLDYVLMNMGLNIKVGGVEVCEDSKHLFNINPYPGPIAQWTEP